MEIAPPIVKTPQPLTIACESCENMFFNLLKYVNAEKNIENPWTALQNAESKWSEDEKNRLTKKDNIEYISHSIEETMIGKYFCYTINIIMSYDGVKYQAIVNDKYMLNEINNINQIDDYINSLYFSCFMKL